jgi:hypothetical protein
MAESKKIYPFTPKWGGIPAGFALSVPLSLEMTAIEKQR